MTTQPAALGGRLPALAEPSTTRERLLAAAVQRLESAPLDELTMAGVARLAGVSRQTAYQHFKDRDDLLAVVFIHYAERHLLPEHNRILDRDLSATGLERTFWADVEASRAFFAEVHADRQLRWTVAEFLRGSEQMREYAEAMWVPLLERLKGAGVLRRGLDLPATARWLSYQQTWLVVGPEAIDPDPGRGRDTIWHFALAPLLAPAARRAAQERRDTAD